MPPRGGLQMKRGSSGVLRRALDWSWTRVRPLAGGKCSERNSVSVLLAGTDQRKRQRL